MFYIFTIAIPIIILIVSYYIFSQPKFFSEILSWLLKTCPIMLMYALILYVLEYNSILNTNWTFYTILFFSVVIYPIIAITRLILYLKNKKTSSSDPPHGHVKKEHQEKK